MSGTHHESKHLTLCRQENRQASPVQKQASFQPACQFVEQLEVLRLALFHRTEMHRSSTLKGWCLHQAQGRRQRERVRCLCDEEETQGGPQEPSSAAVGCQPRVATPQVLRESLLAEGDVGHCQGSRICLASGRERPVHARGRQLQESERSESRAWFLHPQAPEPRAEDDFVCVSTPAPMSCAKTDFRLVLHRGFLSR